ncbi:MAG: hypothetical protein JOS17DRAFT_750402 [Linnemannia elongata]|nr:MAG: hypothetical protein JOS17DRAFT_750402 [Linnemannia elongata]
MAPRFPPQSRMPTLLPQKTDVLWYPRERDVEHMHDELSHEEKEFTAKLKRIKFSGTHLIPVGLSKPFIDMDEEGEDEDEEDDEEEDDEDAEGEVEGEGEDELDMGRDLDEDIGQSGDDEVEEDEDTHNYGDQSNYNIEDDDSRQDIMLTMDRLLEEQRRNTMIHEQDELDHCQKIDDQSFIYSPYPSRHYHKDNGSGSDGDEGDIDDSNSVIDDKDTRFTHHRRRPHEPYHEAEEEVEENDGGLLGIDEDEQGDAGRWTRQQQLLEQQLLQQQYHQQQRLGEEEEEMYEERDLDADIEVASSFGGGSDYDEYDHEEQTSRYRTPSPQL